MTTARSRADFAAIPDEGTWLILDKDLEETGRIREEDLDQYGNIQYAQGTVIGLPCRELGGENGTDALVYLRGRIPAKKTAGGWQIAEELGGFLPEPEEGWELSSFSDDFILVRNTTEEWPAACRVLRRADGRILCETEERRRVFLQKSSFVVEKDFGDPESETCIYDQDGRVHYSSGEWIFPCLDDWYFMNRGPWAGVVDAEGKWILRELQYDE